MANQTASEKLRILVVEDESLIRDELAEVLPFYGFDVFAAEDAEKAVQILDEEGPHISFLFTDIHLPGPMNGLMLGRHVRQKWPWIGVLVTSGYGTPDASHMPDGSRFTLKPYKISSIADQIRELTQSRALAGVVDGD